MMLSFKSALVFIFVYTGLQDGTCEISRTVALSKQIDVKTSSFQMVIHSDPDMLPDVRLQYI